jgi:hypothetical protein
VQLGETDLRQVARRLNVDPDELLLANPQIKDPFALSPGQAIYLPLGQEPASLTQESDRPAQEVERCIPPHRESSGKRCKFFVYDSEEPTWVGNVWVPAIYADAAFRPGAYVIPSGKTIADMLSTLLSTYAEKGCDCTEGIQFWSHGSPANGMSITGDGDLEADDFNISGLTEFGDGPTSSPGYRAWHDSLTLKQRRLVLLRRTICDEDSEVYYRSCQGFQQKSGQEFAKASASFWRCNVAGHTKLIGLSQPGKKVLAPCQEPYWSETEGIEEEGKKGKTKNDFAHVKPR